MLIVIYLSLISCTYIFLILLLLSRHPTNSYPLPDYNFQEILAEYKHYACLGAQLHPSLGGICALWRVVKGFSPNLRLCAFLYKLPRFFECPDNWQPAVVISKRSATWIFTTRAHFQGSQALSSLTGQTWLFRTYSRQFGGYHLRRSGNRHSFGGRHLRRFERRGSSNQGGNSWKGHSTQPNRRNGSKAIYGFGPLVSGLGRLGCCSVYPPTNYTPYFLTAKEATEGYQRCYGRWQYSSCCPPPHSNFGFGVHSTNQ